MKKKLPVFNVIWFDVNTKSFSSYDIMTYFDNCYKKLSKPKRPQSFDEFKKFIIDNSKYMFWARCQYEIILSDWPCQMSKEKWDIHQQIMMNINVITELFMNSKINK